RHGDRGGQHPRAGRVRRAQAGRGRPAHRPALHHRPGPGRHHLLRHPGRPPVAKSVRLRRRGRRGCRAEVLRRDDRPPRPLDARGARPVTTATAQDWETTPSPARPAAIRTQDLRKTYESSRGDVEAVRGIDLDVPRGEFFGLLGPNGAGKSTTIGMLTTLVAPTGGKAWVAGYDVVKTPVAVKRRIGVVTQNNTLDMQLTVQENLEFRSRFFGLSLGAASKRAAQLIDAFGLSDRRKAMADQLSGGQARRLMIARALVHQPAVLFLDEPTAGLDPQTRVNLWDILQVLHDQGQTILLTTHYMEE